MTYLCVFGHTNLDYIMLLPRLPEPNTSIQVVEERRFFGGTGANVARIAATLGVPTALSSFVGEDFPHDYLDALKASGVNTGDLRVKRGYLTPVCWTMSDPGHNQITIMNQGPMGDAARFGLEEGALRASEVIHICTGRPEYYIKAVELASELGKLVAFDPGQEIHYVYDAEWFRRVFEGSQLFFCNRKELEVAKGYMGVQSIDDLFDHVETIVLTLGKEGSKVVTADGEIEIPSIEPSEVRDTTGAGDAYRAGFYAGMYRGLPVERCALAGAAAASYAIESVGPQTRIPSWEMVEERMGDE